MLVTQCRGARSSELGLSIQYAAKLADAPGASSSGRNHQIATAFSTRGEQSSDVCTKARLPARINASIIGLTSPLLDHSTR
jgi:hypothetical protein